LQIKTSSITPFEKWNTGPGFQGDVGYSHEFRTSTGSRLKYISSEELLTECQPATVK
jgi:hypothetical protein